MSKNPGQKLIDSQILKAQSHPIRAAILNILSEGPSSPSRMQRRMKDNSLETVSYHVKILRKAALIELVEVKHHGGRKEHIYRATKRQFFDLEEWHAVDPKFRQPILSTVVQQAFEDTGRAMAEGKFTFRPDVHLSRSPIELDEVGWSEVYDALELALNSVLEAHAKSAERSQETGQPKFPARVVMMQFPIGPDHSPGDDTEP